MVDPADQFASQLLRALERRGVSLTLDKKGKGRAQPQDCWVLRRIQGKPVLQNRAIELRLEPSPEGMMLNPDTNLPVPFSTAKPKCQTQDDRLLKAYEVECRERRGQGEKLGAAQSNNLACALGWQGRYDEALAELVRAQEAGPEASQAKRIDSNRDILKEAQEAQVSQTFEPYRGLWADLRTLSEALRKTLGLDIAILVDPANPANPADPADLER